MADNQVAEILRKKREEAEKKVEDMIKRREKFLKKFKEKHPENQEIDSLCKTLEHLKLPEDLQEDDMLDIIEKHLPEILKMQLDPKLPMDKFIDLVYDLFTILDEDPGSNVCKTCNKRLRGKPPQSGICKACREESGDHELESSIKHYEDIIAKANETITEATTAIKNLNENKEKIKEKKRKFQDAQKEYKDLLSSISPVKKQKK